MTSLWAWLALTLAVVFVTMVVLVVEEAWRRR